MAEITGAFPAVSVVMPTYNRVHLLPPVLESILEQDFRNLELVIVDDGSVDETAEFVTDLMSRDERVRLLALSQNHGVGFARQVGLANIRGRYIALADSDDVWLPGRLKLQVQALDGVPEIDVVFGDFWDIDLRTQTKRRAFANSRGLAALETRRLKDDLFLVEGGLDRGILISNFIAIPTVVARREVFERAGGFLVDSMSPDLEFCWRAAVLGATYAYVDRPLIERYIHPDSLSVQKDRPYLERLRALDIMYGTARKAGRPELERHLRAREVDTYLHLMRIYGRARDRRGVVKTFVKSMRRSPSVRSVSYLIVALLGPSMFAGRAHAISRSD
jgi:glycosyltransferase involved in cell wall biosynthesis